ncbi:MAG TPA: family 78 glycoside hydrolase catalytic domain, partial [Clostridia bacterium]
YPKKIFAVEGVVNEGSVLSIDIREYLLSANDSSKHFVSHFYLMCEAVSDKQGEFSLNFCEGLGFLYINGENFDVGIGSKVKIKKGRNIICFGRRCVSYGNQNVLDINGVNLKFGAVYLVGPLPYSKDRTNYPESEWGETVIVEGMDVDENTLNQIAQSATACDLDAIKSKFSSYVTDVSHLVQKNNIFHQSLIDKVVNKDLRCQLKDEEALFGSNSFLTIYPHKDCDIRLLIDYGGETLGYQTFECVAQEGTILDFHNFEFIQPDLRRNYAETMNNSFRYICKEGYQKFEAMVSKGFRYVYITIRNQNAPVKLKNVCNIETVYPQSNKGDFICSDWKLNRIYECCKNTLRCCSQDTYVDCPTYEQVFWVGDARNEAIVDWLINGDSRLWYHCLRLAGDSLNVSPLVQSHTPTGWDNIITAWSALWHRSVYEYMLYTGDYSKAQELRALLLKDIEGIKTFINKDGLYEISAWNLFDWAVMDTPKNAVVTHQNFFVIFAIDYTIKFLRLINEEEKTISELEELKDQLKAAINKYLWSEEKQAFADCLRYGKNGERILSSVFSQQTHTIAYISKGTTQERLQRCYTIVTNPPSGFVVSGSPFFEFFRLEVYSSTKQYQKMYQAISDNWGFMIDAGSDTFWELWSGITLDGRMTRSHCHAWSCAPVYFLTEYILGVSPLEPGYSKVKIKPYAGTLKFCRGVVPTPHGEIRVSWKANDGVITDLQYSVPKGVEVVFDD